MQAEEELSLPPWEKFVKYRLFPYKLCLHLSLVCLITSLVVIINLAFSGYSRTIWQTSVNILYPEGTVDCTNSKHHSIIKFDIKILPIFKMTILLRLIISYTHKIE